MVIDRIQRLPVLLVVTFRPEFEHPWSHYPHVTVQSLDRFSPRHSIAMIKGITGGKALPGPVLDQIVAKADGVPLFLEELTKAVLESGVLENAVDRWRLAGTLTPLAIPATLHDSLMARLDRLAPVKQVAQIAAAIGREFPHDLLAAVCQLDDAALATALHQLSAAELIYRRSMPPDAIYFFKHALVQDAAYASLLRGPRQLIHVRIAVALQERPVECAPEVMAHHLTEAGHADASVDYWARAGRLAVSRAASREAVAHFQRAIAQLLCLPDSVERNRREASLQDALGGALAHVTGVASEALVPVYARARDLCQQTGDTRSQFIAEWNLWHVHIARSEHGYAQALGERLMAVAEQENDPELLLQAHHVEWVALGAKGQHRACCMRCPRVCRCSSCAATASAWRRKRNLPSSSRPSRILRTSASRPARWLISGTMEQTHLLAGSRLPPVATLNGSSKTACANGPLPSLRQLRCPHSGHAPLAARLQPAPTPFIPWRKASLHPTAQDSVPGNDT